MRGMGTYGASSRTNEEASFSSTASLRNFSPGPNSSSRLMSSIENKSTGKVKLESGTFGEMGGDNFVSGFPTSSAWEDSAVLSDNMVALNNLIDDEDGKAFSGLNPSEVQVKFSDHLYFVFWNLKWDLDF